MVKNAPTIHSAGHFSFRFVTICLVRADNLKCKMAAQAAIHVGSCWKQLFMELRPGPRKTRKAAANGGPGNSNYRRTVLGNRWFSRSGRWAGWPPSGCPRQHAQLQCKMPSTSQSRMGALNLGDFIGVAGSAEGAGSKIQRFVSAFVPPTANAIGGSRWFS